MQHPSGIQSRSSVRSCLDVDGCTRSESIKAGRTALVVIDLDTATVGASEECQRLVWRVNEVAAAVRSAGGVVAWSRRRCPSCRSILLRSSGRTGDE
jgi:hypothetical protein